MKRCSKSGLTKALAEFSRHSGYRDGLQYNCKQCIAAGRKDYPVRAEARRQGDLKYRQKHREKYLAHRAIENAVHYGSIQRQPCEVCGNPKSEGHHADYSQKFAVRWLCYTHHRAVHAHLQIGQVVA